MIWIGDIAPGVDDTKVFEISRKDGRIILTEDKDFGEAAIVKENSLLRYPSHLTDLLIH